MTNLMNNLEKKGYVYRKEDTNDRRNKLVYLTWKAGETMRTVNELYEAMQRIAPLELAESWDNPGLLVDCGGTVHRVLTALDITPEVVEEAAAKQCEMIVSHHPVIFDPLIEDDS